MTARTLPAAALLPTLDGRIAQLQRAFLADALNRVTCQDALEFLRSLPSESVHCLVTSPPYYNQRDYGVSGQLGLVDTPDEYIARLVEVFREAQRVLRSDGTCWINMGDSYAGGGRGGNPAESEYQKQATNVGSLMSRMNVPNGLKPKDLMMMPARVALALQADGWWLRSVAPWVKRSAMPESQQDRPTNALEFIYMLTKSGSTQYWTHRDLNGTRKRPEPDYRWIHRTTNEERTSPPPGWATDKRVKKVWRRVNLWRGHDYWFDMDAVRIETTGDGTGQHFRNSARYINQPSCVNNHNHKGDIGETKGYNRNGRARRNTDWYFDALDAEIARLQALRDDGGVYLDDDGLPLAFDINPEPKSFQHFAMYPEALIAPMVRAGCPAAVCAQCGAPVVRVVEHGRPERIGGNAGVSVGHATGPMDRGGNGQWDAGHMPMVRSRQTTGFRPSCDCNAPTRPGVVLDPFMGSGTTALVAQKLGRWFVGSDLNPDYCELATRRVQYHGDDSRMVKEQDAGVQQLDLFGGEMPSPAVEEARA